MVRDESETDAYQHLLQHHLVVFLLWRLSPLIWGVPLLLEEMRGHPRLLLYGLLYALWVALGGVALVAGRFAWPVRVMRFLVVFAWSYLVLVSLV